MKLLEAKNLKKNFSVKAGAFQEDRWSGKSD